MRFGPENTGFEVSQWKKITNMDKSGDRRGHKTSLISKSEG